jgi:hypothetical protein
MNIPRLIVAVPSLAILVALLGCRPGQNIGIQTTERRLAPAVNSEMVDKKPPAQSDNSTLDGILGEVPKAEPDLPVGTAVWIRSGEHLHSLSDFVQVANRRIQSEEKSLPPADTHVQIVLNPDSKSAFVEVMIGSGVGTPIWIVTVDQELHATRYKKTYSRDDPDRGL